MARIGDISLQGDKALIRALSKLESKVEQKFRRTAASQTMRVLRTKARAEAPRMISKTDKSQNLRMAIQTKTSAKKGRPVVGRLFVNYKQGKGKSAWWAHFFEFGTKLRMVKSGPYAGRVVGSIAARRFMSRTYEKNRRKAIRFFQRVMRQQVEAYASGLGAMKFTGTGKSFSGGGFVSKGAP
tara:strand:- start:532 stop:1080 length:549 start_codon:yes stop_codon:yes gene_type:complete